MNFIVNRRRPITHVIFEREGILVNCANVSKAGGRSVFKRYDRHCPQEMRTGLKTDDLYKKTEVLVRGLSAPVRSTNFQNAANDVLYAESWREASEVPGAHVLIDYFQSVSIPMAVVSSTCSCEPQFNSPKLRHLWQGVQTIVASDDPELFFSPPEPDIFMLALKRFEKPPEFCQNVLAFASSEKFAKAAVFSGFIVIWVIEERESRKSHEKTVAYFAKDKIDYIRYLHEFRPCNYGLPSYSMELVKSFHLSATQIQGDDYEL